MGVNATGTDMGYLVRDVVEFQWAPTLGGECYDSFDQFGSDSELFCEFQWAPTLRGECYNLWIAATPASAATVSMGTHP